MSDMKCPSCGQELKQDYNRDTLFHKCNKCWFRGDTILWLSLIQAKQDLEIARKALEEIRDETGEDRAGFSYVVLAINMKTIAENALEQIEHKE